MCHKKLINTDWMCKNVGGWHLDGLAAFFNLIIKCNAILVTIMDGFVKGITNFNTYITQIGKLL